MQQRSDFVPWIWQRNREVGHVKTKTLKPPSLDYNRVANGALYSYIKAVHTWEPTKTVEHTHHGGIFNFDFAPDGLALFSYLPFITQSCLILSTSCTSCSDISHIGALLTGLTDSNLLSRGMCLICHCGGWGSLLVVAKTEFLSHKYNALKM